MFNIQVKWLIVFLIAFIAINHHIRSSQATAAVLNYQQSKLSLHTCVQLVN